VDHDHIRELIDDPRARERERIEGTEPSDIQRRELDKRTRLHGYTSTDNQRIKGHIDALFLRTAQAMIEKKPLRPARGVAG
jgi:hypothetical protein